MHICGSSIVCVRDIRTKMSTNDNITLEISTTDENLTSEMDVPLTQISQIGESSTTAFVQSETVTATSISSRHENKTDETTTALMQLLLTKFDNFDIKRDEQKRDSNLKFDKQNENFNNFKTEIKNEITEIKIEITTQNVQIKSDFNEKFDEIKREIKKRNNNLCLLYTSRCV